MTKPGDEYDGLRLSPSDKQSMLICLESFAKTNPIQTSNRRAAERYKPKYPETLIELVHPGGNRVINRTLVYDISSTGIGFATRGFLHAGTFVTMHLRTIDGEELKVVGKVVWCEYHEKQFHRVGLHLAEALNIHLFADIPESK